MEGALADQPTGGRHSVKSSLCDIAYQYKKRPNVFRLQAFNGSEFLIRAQSKTDMLEWIKAIQEHNNPDNDASPSHDLIVRKAKQSTQLHRVGSQGGTGAMAAGGRGGASAAAAATSTPAAAQGGSAFSAQALMSRFSKSNRLLNWRQRSMDNLSTPVANPFDMTLEEQCQGSDDGLPMVLTKLVAEVERRGLDEEGIYRHSGSSSQMAAIRDGFIKEGAALDLTDENK